MKFGAVAVGHCAGAILAHGLRVADGVLKKGRVLSPDDVRALEHAGYQRIVVARPEAHDVSEDEAAATLAAALAGDGVSVAAAFTGRCNLFARHAGLLLLDSARVDAMNRVNEAMTVATLPAYARVSERQLLATIKIIPFAVPRPRLEQAVASLGGAGTAVRVAAFRPCEVALLQTTLPGTREAMLDKTARVIAERLDALGSRLRWQERCEHSERALVGALGALLDDAPARPSRESPQMVLIVGASAIVDRRDVVPAAICAAGGTLDHFGMPVDPGNLLLLAHRGATPVLGLPGCARSPKFNGFDQVLERLLARVPVEPTDIMAMGVGGLLKETHARPQPRVSTPEIAACPWWRAPSTRRSRPSTAASTWSPATSIDRSPGCWPDARCAWCTIATTPTG